jgi:hypothetical protein
MKVQELGVAVQTEDTVLPIAVPLNGLANVRPEGNKIMVVYVVIPEETTGARARAGSAHSLKVVAYEARESRS